MGLSRGAAAWYAAWHAVAWDAAALGAFSGLVTLSPGHAALGAALGAGWGLVHGGAVALAVVYADRQSWRRACGWASAAVLGFLAFPMLLVLPYGALLLFWAATPFAVPRWIAPRVTGAARSR